jgi:very-short-patch-repair endonuclease
VPAHVLRTSDLTVGHGAFALPGAPPALVTAVRLSGVVSHASAAALQGLRPWHPDPTVHITVATGTRSSGPDLRIHRARLRPDEVEGLVAMTTPLRTVIDCARTMPRLDALILLDAALHDRLVRLADVRAAAATIRGKGAAAVRQVVGFASRLADSPLETVLRVILEILGCAYSEQKSIRGVGAVDFLVEGWLLLEGDGFEFHSGRDDYRRDRRRGNAAAERGLVPLRFSYEDLRFRPGGVLEQIARVHALGPPRRN